MREYGGRNHSLSGPLQTNHVKRITVGLVLLCSQMFGLLRLIEFITISISTLHNIIPYIHIYIAFIFFASSQKTHNSQILNPHKPSMSYSNGSITETHSPTHIDIALFLQQTPNRAPVLPQEVLHVHLLWLVTGEGHVQLTQHPVAVVTFQLLLVYVVLVFVPTTEEEDSVSEFLA